MPHPYDLCVIGAGPAGYAAAMRGHDLGQRVLLIEAGALGGAGVHRGALSSKALWHLSNDYAGARRTDRGYIARDLSLSYPAVMEAVAAATQERASSMARQLDALAHPNAAGASVTLRRGRARFRSPYAVEIVDREGKLDLVEARTFVIATGSRPRQPSGVLVDGRRVLTSDEIEGLPAFPRSLLIIGAGVIGCEYATIFANFGETAVNLMDREPRILPFEDEDVARVIHQRYTQLGVNIHQGCQLGALEVHEQGVRYEVTHPDGRREARQVESVLYAIGRVPNTEHLGLEQAGVQTRPGGAILVEGTRTSAPHIHAAGDITADIALANVAELEGRHAVESLAGLEPRPIRYEALSSILFLSPEVAAVGLNEQQARARGVPYRVAVLQNALVARNIAMRATTGLVKLLASPEGRLLGLRVVGPQAASTVQGVAFLINQGATLDDIDRCIHAHPAVPEAVQECARLLLGRSVHKPVAFSPDEMRVGEG